MIIGGVTNRAVPNGVANTDQLRYEMSTATRRLLFAVPAVGTQLALVKADGPDYTVYSLEA